MMISIVISATSSTMKPIDGLVIGFHEVIIIIGSLFFADDFNLHKWRHKLTLVIFQLIRPLTDTFRKKRKPAEPFRD